MRSLTTQNLREVGYLLTFMTACHASPSSFEPKSAPHAVPSVPAGAHGEETAAPAWCLATGSLREVCSRFAVEHHVPDCAVGSELDLGAGALIELVAAWNPPADLKARMPIGISGRRWWLESTEVETRIDRHYVLRVGSAFYSVGETSALAGLTEELNASQPAELVKPGMVQLIRSTTTGDPPARYASQDLAIITLQSPPRVAVYRSGLFLSTKAPDGYSSEQGRTILGVGRDAVLLSAETVTGADGNAEELSGPARVHYCSGEQCPLACNRAWSADVGTLEPEPDAALRIDGPHLELAGRRGGHVECLSEHTMQARLLSCTMSGTKRTVSVALSATGEFRCGEHLPEFNYLNGGFFATDEGSLVGDPRVVGFELSTDLMVVLDTKNARLEVRTPTGTEVVDFASAPTPARTRVDRGATGAAWPSRVVDLTQVGTGCN